MCTRLVPTPKWFCTHLSGRLLLVSDFTGCGYRCCSSYYSTWRQCWLSHRRMTSILGIHLVLLGFGWRSRAVFPAPLVLEGTGSKLRRIRESYWWPSYGSSQPPILQAIATAVETTPFIGTLRRNPISIRHSGGISIPRLEAFKADTSCGSVVQGSWHGPSIRDVYRFLAGKDVGAPTGTHPMHHSIAYPREGNRTNLHTSG